MQDELPSVLNDKAVVVKDKRHKLSCLCSLTAELHLATLRVAHSFDSWPLLSAYMVPHYCTSMCAGIVWLSSGVAWCLSGFTLQR